MPQKLKPRKHSWQFDCFAPPREIFAVMEQMCGTPPYRFEVIGPSSARVVEYERKGFFGQWASLERRGRDGAPKADKDGETRWKRPPAWVTVSTAQHDDATQVAVDASAGRFVAARAVQLIELLTRGAEDRRTVYRDRSLPPGPVTLVASWAGMLYHVYTEPAYDAPRGPGVHTASHLSAIGNVGPFVHVRLDDGTEGYIEKDQLVASPTEATRAAQVRTALRQG
jgi:hypothetical protein